MDILEQSTLSQIITTEFQKIYPRTFVPERFLYCSSINHANKLYFKCFVLNYTVHYTTVNHTYLLNSTCSILNQYRVFQLEYLLYILDNLVIQWSPFKSWKRKIFSTCCYSLDWRRIRIQKRLYYKNKQLFIFLAFEFFFYILLYIFVY